jgi:hypothetical protein
MNENGTLNWKDANVEYYNPFPFTGKVRLDETFILSDFVSLPSNVSPILALTDLPASELTPRRHGLETRPMAPGDRDDR